MSDIFQITEIVSHIFHFIDKNNTKTISLVNRLFYHIAIYQLAHSLKSKWENGHEQFESIKIKSPKVNIANDLIMEISCLDDQTGSIFLINLGDGKKQGILSVTHFYDSKVKVQIYQWNATEKVIPSFVKIPPFLSHTRKPELYLVLDNTNLNSSEYVNLTNVNSVSSIKCCKTKLFKQSFFRMFTELTGFNPWAPFWGEIIDSDIIDNIELSSQFYDEFDNPNYKRCYCVVSVDEFYLIIYNNNATFFTVYSFLLSTVVRFDCTLLIKNYIQEVNLLDVVASVNNQQWLIIHAIWEKPLALNLKTKQCIQFHHYHHSINRFFILFEPEPILLIQNIVRSFELHLVTQNKCEFLSFKHSGFKSFWGFDESNKTIMFTNLFCTDQKKVISISLNDFLNNKIII